MEFRQIFLLILIEIPISPITITVIFYTILAIKLSHVLLDHGGFLALELSLEEFFDLFAEGLVVDLEAEGALGRFVLLLAPTQAGVMESVPARVDHNVWHFNDRVDAKAADRAGGALFSTASLFNALLWLDQETSSL